MAQVVVHDTFNRVGNLSGSTPDVYPNELINSNVAAYIDYLNTDEGGNNDYTPYGWYAGGGINVTDGTYAKILSGEGSAFLPGLQFAWISNQLLEDLVEVARSNIEPNSAEFYEFISRYRGPSVLDNEDHENTVKFAVPSLNDGEITSVVALGWPYGTSYIKGGIDTSWFDNYDFEDASLPDFRYRTNGLLAVKIIASAQVGKNYAPFHWSWGGERLAHEIYYNISYVSNREDNPPTWVDNNLSGPYPVEFSAGSLSGFLQAFSGHYYWISEGLLDTAHSTWGQRISAEYSADADVLVVRVPGTDSSPILVSSQLDGNKFYDGKEYFIFDGSKVLVPETPGAGIQSEGWAGVYLPGYYNAGVANKGMLIDDFYLKTSIPSGSSGWYVGIPTGGSGGLSFVNYYAWILAGGLAFK